MHIVIAPNAFKGSLSAEDAAACIAAGIRDSPLKCELTLFPIADGGDDTASLLNKKWKAQTITLQARDPLGRSVITSFGWIPAEKKAVISLSDISGIKLLRRGELNPLHADTCGTGELIKASLDKGAQKIIVGAGGSATVDGGTGLLKALGLRYYDHRGNEINDIPSELIHLDHIALSNLDRRLSSSSITVLCDVQNKLLGDDGAARIFGPQKGATEQEVEMLEERLRRWNDKTKDLLGVNMDDLKYCGAAGGTAAGLAAYAKATLINGTDFFLDAFHFDDLLKDADRVITAEGSIDGQTLEGKGPFGVAYRAGQRHIPVTGMAGQIQENKKDRLLRFFTELMAINPPGMDREEAIKNTAIHLRETAMKWARAQCL